MALLRRVTTLSSLARQVSSTRERHLQAVWIKGTSKTMINRDTIASVELITDQIQLEQNVLAANGTGVLLSQQWVRRHNLTFASAKAAQLWYETFFEGHPVTEDVFAIHHEIRTTRT